MVVTGRAEMERLGCQEMAGRGFAVDKGRHVGGGFTSAGESRV